MRLRLGFERGEGVVAWRTSTKQNHHHSLLRHDDPWFRKAEPC